MPLRRCAGQYAVLGYLYVSESVHMKLNSVSAKYTQSCVFLWYCTVDVKNGLRNQHYFRISVFDACALELKSLSEDEVAQSFKQN